ncbi:hypothetical protein ['Paenibacillus yunnanensis' Narsing Rao et al. 2020]|uniref:hypothetical protein n=1 Tax=Paenibacillus tengchongensis TaxID=2608684 RepID=UPI00165272F3|nr:hypothetical protein [Paenibacillus tengchongensis]
MPGQGTVKLGWYNLKLTANSSWLLSLLLLVVIPFFMDPGLMGAAQAAKLGALLLSFIGLIVFPHLALLEEGGTGEVVFGKVIRPFPLFLFRWLITFAFIVLAVGLLYMYLRQQGASVSVWALTASVAVTAAALGSCGMTAALLLRSLPAGYITGFAWYLIDYSTKGKLTGAFYLFGFLKHGWGRDQWLLGALALALALFCAWLLPRRRLD